MQFPSAPPPPPPSAFSQPPPNAFPSQALPKPSQPPPQPTEQPKEEVKDALFPAREQLRLQRERERQREIEERQKRDAALFASLHSSSNASSNASSDPLEKLKSQTSFQYPNLHLQPSLDHAQQFQNLSHLHPNNNPSANGVNANGMNANNMNANGMNANGMSGSNVSGQKGSNEAGELLQKFQQLSSGSLQPQPQQQSFSNPQSSLQMQFVGQHSINPNYLQQQLLNPHSFSGPDDSSLSKRLSNLNLTLQPDIALNQHQHQPQPQPQPQPNMYLPPPSNPAFSSNLGNENLLYSSFSSQPNAIPSSLLSSFSSQQYNNNNNGQPTPLPQSESERLLYRSLSSMNVDPHTNQSLSHLFAHSNTSPHLNTSPLYPSPNPPSSTVLLPPPPAYSTFEDGGEYESEEGEEEGEEDPSYLLTQTTTTTNNSLQGPYDPELQRYSQLTYGHHKSKMKKAKKILIPIATTSGGVILGAMGGAVVGAAAGGVGAPVGAVVGALIGGGMGLTTGVAAVSGQSTSSSVVVANTTYKKAKNCRGCGIPFKCLTCGYFFCPDCGFQYCEFCSTSRGIEKVCKYCGDKSSRTTTTTQRIAYRDGYPQKQIEYYD